MSNALEPRDFTSNRRAEPRVSAARKLDILPCQASDRWGFVTANMRDCSPSGIGLIIHEQMAVGSQFLAKLKLTSGVKLLLYTVHNCIALSGGQFRIGARFSGFAAQQFDEDPAKVMEALLRGE